MERVKGFCASEKMLLLIVLAFLWEKTTSTSCCAECPDPTKIVERQPGIRYAVDCSISSGSCKPLEFHLNDMPLNVQSDGNLRFAYCDLEIISLSSAYEGFYNCSYNNLPSTLQECIYVLGTPRFLNCGDSEDTCVISQTATERENVTMNFDIIYENGGCNNLNITLYLSKPGSDVLIRLPANDSYNCSTKIRRVQQTLSQVTSDDQGFYNLTMTALDNSIEVRSRVLSISLTVNEAPTSMRPMTPEASTTLPPEQTSTVHSTATAIASTQPHINETHSVDEVIAPVTTIVIPVVIVGTVVTVVTAVGILIACIQWRNKRNVKKQPENTLAAPDLCHTTRKPSDSTSGGSMPTFDLTDTLEIVTTVQPQGTMKVGNGAPEEESSSRHHRLVAMERGQGSPSRPVCEGPLIRDSHDKGWTEGCDEVHVCACQGMARIRRLEGGQHQTGCCSGAACRRLGPTETELVGPCGHHVRGTKQAELEVGRRLDLEQESRTGHQEDRTTREALVGRFVPHTVTWATPQCSNETTRHSERICSKCKLDEEDDTLRLVTRPDHYQERQQLNQERQQLNHCPICLIGQWDYHNNRRISTISSSSKRTSITSSPGDGNDFNFTNYLSSARDV